MSRVKKSQITICQELSSLFKQMAEDTTMNQPDKQFHNIEQVVTKLPLDQGKGGMLESLYNMYIIVKNA